jgi:hydrogenase/urease accessory protein HupE
MRLLLLCILVGVLCHGSFARAHESRPAYLEINETAPGRYEVLWRTPINAGMRLPVVLKFPGDTRNITEPSVAEFSGLLLERRVVDAGKAGLAGKRIDFVGLQATITDVLVRVQLLDGTHSTTLVHPSHAWVEVAASQGIASVAGAYFMLGIEHILFGTDHLLFVLGLMLMVRDRWMLLKTITAFTVAHSITLAGATLDFVRVPGPPIEAAIALSIVLVAVEIVNARRGIPSFAARWPWLIAFSFGLLHGFGFAGALAEVGLPHHAIPVALLFFNLGVEFGQLVFVAMVWTVGGLLRRAATLHRTPSQLVMAMNRIDVMAAYAIGAVASFWLVERTYAFLV